MSVIDMSSLPFISSTSTGTGSRRTRLENMSAQVIKRSLCGELTIALDERLRLLHLLEQLGVTNDTRGIAHFAARLVQTRDDAHDRALGNICQVGNVAERLWELSALF